MDIFYQCWTWGSSVLNYSGPISSSGGKWRDWSWDSSVCVCVSEEQRETETERGECQWLSQHSFDLIKAIHHIWIIRQQHGWHDLRPWLSTYSLTDYLSHLCVHEHARVGKFAGKAEKNSGRYAGRTIAGKTCWHLIQRQLVSNGVESSFKLVGLSWFGFQLLHGQLNVQNYAGRQRSQHKVE